MRRAAFFGLVPLVLAACSGGADVDNRGPRADGCDYPDGAVEPMALDRVIWPYAWDEAKSLSDEDRALRLEDVYCNTDDDMDWSPFDVLLFVSVPAW